MADSSEYRRFQWLSPLVAAAARGIFALLRFCAGMAWRCATVASPLNPLIRRKFRYGSAYSWGNVPLWFGVGLVLTGTGLDWGRSVYASFVLGETYPPHVGDFELAFALVARLGWFVLSGTAVALLLRDAARAFGSGRSFPDELRMLPVSRREMLAAGEDWPYIKLAAAFVAAFAPILCGYRPGIDSRFSGGGWEATLHGLWRVLNPESEDFEPNPFAPVRAWCIVFLVHRVILGVARAGAGLLFHPALIASCGLFAFTIAAPNSSVSDYQTYSPWPHLGLGVAATWLVGAWMIRMAWRAETDDAPTPTAPLRYPDRAIVFDFVRPFGPRKLARFMRRAWFLPIAAPFLFLAGYASLDEVRAFNASYAAPPPVALLPPAWFALQGGFLPGASPDPSGRYVPFVGAGGVAIVDTDTSSTLVFASGATYPPVSPWDPVHLRNGAFIVPFVQV